MATIQTKNETPEETPAVVPLPVAVSIENPKVHLEPSHTNTRVNVSVETPTDVSVQTRIQPIQSPIDPVEPQTQTLLKIQRGIKLHQR